MPHCSLAAGDGPSSRTHQSQAAVSSNSWSLTKLARASAGGASGGRVRRAILSRPSGGGRGVLAGQRATRRFGAAALGPLAFVGIVGPALGASAWPWRWTSRDWKRELLLKSAMAIAIIAAL